MHRVVVLALDGVVPFEASIPARIFGAAYGPDRSRFYEVLTCGVTAGPVRTSADFSIVVEHGAELLETADTVVVPPAYSMLDLVASGAPLPSEVSEALERIPARARKVAICTGAFMLAAAGILDGRKVTTHWGESARLTRLFPALSVDEDVLYVQDEDVFTSAGVAAGIDLCLHLVRSDHGSRVANQAARLCVVPPTRAGGQAQFIERPVPASPEDAGGTAAVRTWALKNLGRPLSLQELAGEARMSVRTFTRQFRVETGVSPGEWLAQQRVDLARHLLEATDLPVDRIAERAGFGTSASLRQQLRARVGVSPGAYRRTFQGAAGTDDRSGVNRALVSSLPQRSDAARSAPAAAPRPCHESHSPA